MIGDITAAEWRGFTDPETGRRVTQLTSAKANSYPLYYFVSSFTSDARYLVFHSERSGLVQLYRLDLESGEIGQLTEGRTRDAGWAIWCEWHLDGIYNHLSAINPKTDEVYYFEGDEIRSSHVPSFANRLLAKLPPGRMPIGQSAVSPDGSLFGFVHVDAANYVALLTERENRIKAGLPVWGTQHHRVFRNAVPTALALVETATGAIRTVIETDYHFHHVLFADDQTILVNHPPEVPGMWTIGVGGGPVTHVRPADAAGAHNAAVVHQVITNGGIVYEAVDRDAAGNDTTYFGKYDPATGSFFEHRIPLDGYMHAGLDPAGKFDFIERAGGGHELWSLNPPDGPEQPRKPALLYRLRSPAHDDQRQHAHPFLSPDRQRLFFGDWSEDGYAQVHYMDMAGLT
ncbi:MAG TPA: hypothetical protein VF253_08290 [Candidatus Limnocylindrales bacterium]